MENVIFCAVSVNTWLCFLVNILLEPTYTHWNRSSPNFAFNFSRVDGRLSLEQIYYKLKFGLELVTYVEGIWVKSYQNLSRGKIFTEHQSLWIFSLVCTTFAPMVVDLICPPDNVTSKHDKAIKFASLEW